MGTKAIADTESTTLTRIASGVVFLVVTVLLAFFGVQQFRDGLANNAAIPVPVYMVAQIKMPKVAYDDAASSLAGANPRDGLAKLNRAEALMRAGAPEHEVVGLVGEAVAETPASARAWTLLGEVLYPRDKKAAARALSQGLLLAPREYYLVAPQVLDASRLWPELDADSRTAVLAKARLLWDEPSLRYNLRVLLRAPGLAPLISQAFQQDEIRDMNRWLLSKERQEPLP